jgi:hypothetical protein
MEEGGVREVKTDSSQLDMNDVIDCGDPIENEVWTIKVRNGDYNYKGTTSNYSYPI